MIELRTSLLKGFIYLLWNSIPNYWNQIVYIINIEGDSNYGLNSKVSFKSDFKTIIYPTFKN